MFRGVKAFETWRGDASNRSLPKPLLLVTAREDVHTGENREQRKREKGERHSGREEWRVNRGGREKKGNDVKNNRGSRGEVGGGQGEDKKEAERERKPSSTAVAGQEA